jgi:hypothetical protein
MQKQSNWHSYSHLACHLLAQSSGWTEVGCPTGTAGQSSTQTPSSCHLLGSIANTAAKLSGLTAQQLLCCTLHSVRSRSFPRQIPVAILTIWEDRPVCVTGNVAMGEAQPPPLGTNSDTAAGRALTPRDKFQGAEAVALGQVRVPAVPGPESTHTPQAQNRDCSTATLVTL